MALTERGMGMAQLWSVRLASLVIGTAVLLTEDGASAGLSPTKDFKNVKSCKEAVELVQRRLKQDGKAEYVALLSETRVRKAIYTAIKSWESLLDKEEKRHPGSKDYFLREVVPVYLKIADKGEWPEGSSFFWFYTLGSRGGVYDGLGLRLRIDTPKAKFKAFALPIVDLYFGRAASLP
jgi:hypothetical protein